MRRQKKQPKDYPPFVFRLSNQAQKEALEKKVKDVLKIANARLEENDRHYTKSEVIVAAINAGLELVKKNKVSLPD